MSVVVCLGAVLWPAVVPVDAEARQRVYPVAPYSCVPDDLVPLPNGDYLADECERIVRVAASGRVTRLPGEFQSPRDLSLMADGGVLVADSGLDLVKRIGPDGSVSTVAGGGDAYPGEAGPATAAELRDVWGVAATADGGFLIAGEYRVQRVSPDGTIRTVAGSDTRGEILYGVDARATRLHGAVRVASSSDGGFLIFGRTAVSRVGPDHVISLVTHRRVAMAEDGTLYGLTRARQGYAGPGVRISTIEFGHGAGGLVGGSRPGFFGGFGDPAIRAWLADDADGILDVEPMADGELLISSDRYPAPAATMLVAPGTTERLAVAIARETIPALRDSTVFIRSTRPGRVSLDVFLGKHRVGRRLGRVRQGLTKLRLPRAVGPGIHKLVLRARTADGSVAFDEQFMLLGDRLPRSLAVEAVYLAVNFLDFFPVPKGRSEYFAERLMRCARLDARRVDCHTAGFIECEDCYPPERVAACVRVVAVRLRRSGDVQMRPYDCRRRAGSWFHREAPWRGRAIQAPPLSSLVP